MGSVCDSDSELDFIFHAPVVCKSPADKDGCEGGSASLTSHLGAAATHRSVGYEESIIAAYLHLFVYTFIEYTETDISFNIHKRISSQTHNWSPIYYVRSK